MKKLLNLLALFLMAIGANAQTVLYENDFTGITEFTGWAQFSEEQTDGKVEPTTDGVAITVGIQTGQLWQPQVMIVPNGSFNLEEDGAYKVIITAKYPTNGTLQINMGSWSANDQYQFPITSTGDFQTDEFLFEDWSVTAVGAHLIFMCGDFKGTTIVKKIQIIDLNKGEKWTIAGDESLLGSDWDVNNISNNLYTTDGVNYSLTKNEIVLSKGTYQYKVFKDNSTQESYPSSNASLSINEDGVYNVKFTFNTTTKELAASATKVEINDASSEYEIAEGFYHIRNAVTGRYMSINDTNPGNYQATQAGDVNMAGLRTYLNYDSVAVSPSCVIYVRHLGNGKYDLVGQGSSLCNMFNQKLDIHVSAVNNGTYKIYGTTQGITRYLADGSPSDEDSWMMNRLSETEYWVFNPINTTNEYIAVRPDIKTADGHYFGTIYAGFSFRLASEGMAAFYVSNAGGTGVTLNQIAGDVVPACTPVVIRCNSADIRDNKIEPVIGGYTFDKINWLGGVYCSLNVTKHRNTTLYDQITMRLLSLNDDGELAFVKDVPAERLYKEQYLMANKAYLKVNPGDADIMAINLNYLPKCATPVISYIDNKLSFSSETEGAIFHYTIINEDVKSGIGNEIQLGTKYHITAYATKTEYEKSDVASMDIVIISNGHAIVVGDVDGDGKVNVADHVKLSDIIMGK